MSKRKFLCIAVCVIAFLSVGITSCTSTNDQTPEGRGGQQMGLSQGGQDTPQEIDFASAAKILGVSEADLKAAMGDPRDGKPDFAVIAEKLGVTEEALIEALGLQAMPPQR